MMAKAKALLSIALVLAIVVVAVKLAAAPLYRRYDSRQCREAYAAARTRDDSSRVDLHPYGTRNERCGVTRATPLYGLPLARQGLHPDSLFPRLVGNWVLRGTIARQQTTHDVTFDWMLGREYVQMHEVSRERAANGS